MRNLPHTIEAIFVPAAAPAGRLKEARLNPNPTPNPTPNLNPNRNPDPNPDPNPNPNQARALQRAFSARYNLTAPLPLLRYNTSRARAPFRWA